MFCENIILENINWRRRGIVSHLLGDKDCPCRLPLLPSFIIGFFEEVLTSAPWPMMLAKSQLVNMITWIFYCNCSVPKHAYVSFVT